MVKDAFIHEVFICHRNLCLDRTHIRLRYFWSVEYRYSCANGYPLSLSDDDRCWKLRDVDVVDDECQVRFN